MDDETEGRMDRETRDEIIELIHRILDLIEKC